MTQVRALVAASPLDSEPGSEQAAAFHLELLVRVTLANR